MPLAWFIVAAVHRRPVTRRSLALSIRPTPPTTLHNWLSRALRPADQISFRFHSTSPSNHASPSRDTTVSPFHFAVAPNRANYFLRYFSTARYNKIIDIKNGRKRRRSIEWILPSNSIFYFITIRSSIRTHYRLIIGTPRIFGWITGKRWNASFSGESLVTSSLVLSSLLESEVTQWLDTFESAIDYVISSGSLIPRTSLETSLASRLGEAGLPSRR